MAFARSAATMLWKIPRRLAPLVTTTAAFLAAALTGGLWIGFAQRIGPIGAGRIIAAMQGMVGYVILGIMVSNGFQLLAPSESPGDPG